MDVTVVVATFGPDHWAELARERAVPSAEAQAPVIHVHGETLAGSRNAGLAQVDTEYAIHLDADDELAPGYVEAMCRGVGDVRVPRVAYVRPGKAAVPRFPKVPAHTHECGPGCLYSGNYIVVGAAVRTELARRVGWQEYPIYEDWAMWLGCLTGGAAFGRVPEAVYRAHVRNDSRNREPSIVFKNRWHKIIYEMAT